MALMHEFLTSSWSPEWPFDDTGLLPATGAEQDPSVGVHGTGVHEMGDEGDAQKQDHHGHHGHEDDGQQDHHGNNQTADGWYETGTGDLEHELLTSSLSSECPLHDVHEAAVGVQEWVHEMGDEAGDAEEQDVHGHQQHEDDGQQDDHGHEIEEERHVHETADTWTGHRDEQQDLEQPEQQQQDDIVDLTQCDEQQDDIVDWQQYDEQQYDEQHEQWQWQQWHETGETCDEQQQPYPWRVAAVGHETGVDMSWCWNRGALGNELAWKAMGAQ